MSWVSSFLKKNAGIPEVNLLENDFLGPLIAKAASGELAKALAQLDNASFIILAQAVNADAARRKTKSGL